MLTGRDIVTAVETLGLQDTPVDVHLVDRTVLIVMDVRPGRPAVERTIARVGLAADALVVGRAPGAGVPTRRPAPLTATSLPA